MIYLYQKIETYLKRKVDFEKEIVLESRNHFDEDDKFTHYTEHIKEWNAPEKLPTDAELEAITEYVEPIFELSEEEKINQQINELKTQLTATDYKVIKSVESGITLSDEVVGKRQSIRDEINLLEAKLEKLKLA